jgi:hypothetical protein
MYLNVKKGEDEGGEKKMKNEAKSTKSVKKEGMRNLLAPPRAHIFDGEARRRKVRGGHFILKN